MREIIARGAAFERRVVDRQEAIAFFQDPRGAWALMSDGEFADLQARVPGLCVAGRRPRLDAKLSDLIDRTPPPDVLLVTNRCAPAAR